MPKQNILPNIDTQSATKSAQPQTIIAYTDGACKGNPGAGGWGVHLEFADGRIQDLYAGEINTTNNRMELMAAIQALKYVSAISKDNGDGNDNNRISTSTYQIGYQTEIWTDSTYVKDGITQWIHNWKKNNWRTSSKKTVANKDLWQTLDDLNQQLQPNWHWVKGHAGHQGNETADQLANMGVQHPDGNLYQVYETNNATNDSDNFIQDSARNAAIDSTHNTTQITTEFTDINTTHHNHNAYQNSQPTHQKPIAQESMLQESMPKTSTPQTPPIQTLTNQTTQNPHNNEMNWINDDPLGFDQFQDEIDVDVNDGNDAKDGYAVYANGVNADDATVNTSPSIVSIASIDDHSTNMSQQIEEAPKFDGDTSRANPNFRPLLPQPINRHQANRQLIMDTETTGLNANDGDRIIEVGIVEMVGRKFTGEKLHVYVNPQRGMSEEVIRVHGISEVFLQDMPTFDKVAKAVYDFMDGAEVIAHNASFDMNFLNMEFAKVGLGDFTQRVKVTDSLAIAKHQYPGQKNTLDALVKRLNVGKQDRTFHGALLDSEILAEVYLAMTGGQVSLAIDDDMSQDGDTNHANFNELASMLITAPRDDADHQEWLTKVSGKFPSVAEVWGS